MSDIRIRTIQTQERDAVLDLLKEWLNDRAFFARYFHHDPEFRDDLCFVASDGERIVSTFQVFRKQVRVGSAVLQVAGVGNVFTAEEHREEIARQPQKEPFPELPIVGYPGGDIEILVQRCRIREEDRQEELRVPFQHL